MKYVKLYESYIDDVNTKIEQDILDTHIHIDHVLQTLIDHYGLAFDDCLFCATNLKFTDQYSDITFERIPLFPILCYFYKSDSRILVDEDFIKEIISVHKKLLSMGLNVEINYIKYEFLIKGKMETNSTNMTIEEFITGFKKAVTRGQSNYINLIILKIVNNKD